MVFFQRNRRELAASLVALLLSFMTVLDTVNAIPTISTTGTKLFDSDGNQFFLKGVFYEVDPDDDVLANSAQCKIDAPMMEKMGINTIRVRNVDPTYDASHHDCMAAFANAGIYVLIHFHRDLTGVSPTVPAWNEFMFNNYIGILDTFSSYDNLLGLVADNVKTEAAGTTAAPYIKASISDMKTYRDSMGYRNFPIGYIAGYDTDISLAQYLTCGAAEDAVDFFGFNGDQWCESENEASEDLNDFAIDASEFTVPVFEGNVGCGDTDIQMKHQEVIRGTDVGNVVSGGLLYNWASEDGVTNPHFVTIPDDADDQKPIVPVVNNPFASDFQNVWEDNTPTLTSKSDYTPTTTVGACPSSNSDWDVALGQSLPTLADSLITGTATPSDTDGSDESIPSRDPVAVPNSIPGTEPQSNGLSSGAKAAIGAGVAVPLVVVIAAIAFLLFYRRRRQQRKRENELAAGLARKDPPAHMQQQQQQQQLYEKEQPDQIPPRPELNGQTVQEIPRELEGHRFVGELEDTSQPTANQRH